MLLAIHDAQIAERGGPPACTIFRDHPFVDGNKRVGLVLLELFLALNGFGLRASDAECYDAIVSAARGEVTEAEFSRWVEAHSINAE